MEIILHRVNTIADLERAPVHYGVEIDFRTYGKRLILNHEPKADGELFADWLKHFRHRGTLILNPKEEGLESEILELVKKHNIERYFFLDLTMPMLVKWARRGEKRLAVRFSEYETLETCLKFAGQVEWVWIDCFTHVPLDAATYSKLKEHFKLCLVAPELAGHPKERTAEFRELVLKFPMDAVCTDFPELWL